MPTEIEDQIRNYFAWVETRTGHNLRPPLANNPDRDAPVGAVSRLQVESLTAVRVDTAQTRTPRPRAGRFPILLAAAATIAVVAGLAVIGSDRGESPTAPATQPTDPEQAEVAPLPGWEGNLAMKIYMNPNATDTQLELVDQTLANASDLIAAWEYLDADASLQEYERILADEPGTFELLNTDNVLTTFNLVANPEASAASLRQLAAALKVLPGVYDVITPDQARRRDDATNTVGLFPTGDLDAVLLAGFGTPQSAVDAYLADRTRPDVLPDGYSATYSVSDTAERVDDNLSLVRFSLATENDSGDGLLLVRQVASVSEPERWVVVSGGIATFTIDQLEYREGRLSGSFSNEMGGQTEIDVYDATSGERVGRASDNPFVIDNLSSPALSVRFWNTTADGGYPIAVFADALVRDGETVTDIGASALRDTYPTETQPQVEAP